MSLDSRSRKARIVFRGDRIRDESGMSAVFEELCSSSPCSFEALNAAIGFGLLESACLTSFEAYSATYVQNELTSPTHTYATLLSELVLEKTRSTSEPPCGPCARLYKALCGHPLSSALWAFHLGSI